MKIITLFKPIVLRSSLDDMAPDQHEKAIDLLTNRKLLVPAQTGLSFVPINSHGNHDLPKFFLYGSEAVCYYRQSIGLPDVSNTMIDVDDIIANIEDFDTLYDILFLLNRVRMRNERNIKLREYGAPPIILWNEYRMLQEYTESLQNNNWNSHPVINRYNTADPDEDPEWEEEVRKSLAELGYSLLLHEKGTVTTSEE